MRLLVDLGVGQWLLPEDADIGAVVSALGRATQVNETGPWNARVLEETKAPYQVSFRMSVGPAAPPEN